MSRNAEIESMLRAKMAPSELSYLRDKGAELIVRLDKALAVAPQA